MKTLLLSFAFLFTLSGFGQITINLSDLLQVGDTVTRKVDTMTTMTAGPAGTNQSWIMTTVTEHLTEVSKGVAPSSTPYSSSFSSSNIAITNNNVDYLYMNQTGSTVIIKGLAGDLLKTGCNLTAPFSPDMLLHNLPRTYGSTFTDSYGMNIETSGSCAGQSSVSDVKYERTASITDNTDGWGVITTPVGKYQVLRIKRTETATETNSYKLFSFSSWTVESTNNTTTDSYSWISKEGKLAIAELTYDAQGNPKKFTWSLTPPLSASIASSSATCSGVCTGMATVTASGLYTPYTYIWSNGEAAASASALCAGANSVTVTDNLGNSKVLSVTISESPAVNAAVSATGILCNGESNGSASVTASGGTPPFDYLWSTVPAQTTAAITGLGAGTYSVTVTDAADCYSVGTVILEEPAAISLNITSTNASSSTSSNGTATATVSGGTPPYTYTWSNSQTSATATALAAGSYSVTVTDGNGCTKNGTVTVGAGVGIASLSLKNALTVFPNPASDKIYFSGLNENTSLVIFDVTGRLIEKMLINKNTNAVSISYYPVGIYYYRLSDAQGTIIYNGRFDVKR